MKIIDKTPYRSEAGVIDIFGRIQGTLKYGLTWYSRIQAQDQVIAIIEKQLGGTFTLVRNATLPNTEINLPLVLVGPPGVFLINVTHERGVYMARDDEWGTMAGSPGAGSGNFVPARINQVSRTLTFGRVLQVYLDRQGFKGTVVVESILMAADPGMHIESTRPAVRIVMSDALERFAASVAQGHATLNLQTANNILNAILVGRAPKPATEPGVPAPQPGPSAPAEAPSAFSTYTPGQPETQGSAAFSAADFSFDDQPSGVDPTTATNAAPVTPRPANAAPTASSAQQPRPRAARAPARKRSTGLTRNQWLILGGLLFFWLCVMAGFAIYVIFFANA